MKKLGWFLGVVFILGIVGYFIFADKINLYFAGSKTTINTKETNFYVYPDTDLEYLAADLENKGIIDDVNSLVSVGDYKKLNNSNIASGKYLISTSVDYKTLLNGFTLNSLGNGNAEKEVSVTFNNCKDIYQLAGKASNNVMFDSTEFVNFILADSTLRKYGFSEERIGALFLPDTYNMFWDTDAEQFVARMAKEFKAFWTDERKAKLKKVGLNSQSEATTIASIVYKEQDKHPEEWATIAGLYLNRVRNGWMLQSDPTFRFCWGDKLDGVQRLTYEHRAIECPYNTYLYAGLPPGPICIPPAKVIDAVLNSGNEGYFYMCAKPNGNGLHNFAKTLSQHNINARKFQRWMDTRN